MVQCYLVMQKTAEEVLFQITAEFSQSFPSSCNRAENCLRLSHFVLVWCYYTDLEMIQK